MPKGEIAGAIGGDDENHLLTKTQKLEETIVEVRELDLQGCSLSGDEACKTSSECEGEHYCHQQKCVCCSKEKD